MKRKLRHITLFIVISGLLLATAGCGNNTSSSLSNSPNPQSLVSTPSTTDISIATSSNNQSNVTVPTNTTKSATNAATTQSSKPPASTTSVTPAPTTAANNQSMTVYVGATGTKYHYENCRTLKNTKIPMSITDAKDKGYTPCGVCHPPQ